MSFKNVFKHVPIFPSFLDNFSLGMEFWADRICKISAHCFTDVNTLSSGLRPVIYDETLDMSSTVSLTKNFLSSGCIQHSLFSQPFSI